MKLYRGLSVTTLYLQTLEVLLNYLGAQLQKGTMLDTWREFGTINFVPSPYLFQYVLKYSIFNVLSVLRVGKKFCNNTYCSFKEIPCCIGMSKMIVWPRCPYTLLSPHAILWVFTEAFTSPLLGLPNNSTQREPIKLEVALEMTPDLTNKYTIAIFIGNKLLIVVKCHRDLNLINHFNKLDTWCVVSQAMYHKKDTCNKIILHHTSYFWKCSWKHRGENCKIKLCLADSFKWKCY